MTAAIREAAPADRAALVALWIEAWRAAMPQIDFEARRAWFSTHLDALESGGAAILVVCHEGEPTGFITVDASGTVDQLAVSIDHQGRGLAGDLVAAARVRAPQGLQLSVNTDNGRALSFYRRQGFVVVGRGVNTRSGLPVLHLSG